MATTGMPLPSELQLQLQLHLASFFSPLSRCPAHPLPSSRLLAVLGPLPPSTPLHLALSYARARKQEEDSAAAFPSSPYILVLSASRERWHASLVEENDEYLAMHGGDPAVAALLEECTEIRFLESMAAFMFFCAAVNTPASATDGLDREGWLSLRQTPDLVIAHGLANYLHEKRNIGAGIEVYSSLLASLLSAFPSSSTQIVLLDDPSPLHKSLPLLPSTLSSQLRRAAPEAAGGSAEQSDRRTMVELEKLVEHFFDVVGTVESREGSEEGEVVWYEIDVRRVRRLGEETAEEEGDGSVNARYAVHRTGDESGYSGRERFSVRFA